MTTDNEDFNNKNNKDFTSDYNVNNYIEDALRNKYENKPDRMIRRELDNGVLLIGKNRYDALKRIPIKSRSNHQQEQIKIFEDYHGITEYIKTVNKSLKQIECKLLDIEKRKESAKKNINKKTVWMVFKKMYLEVNGKEFIENDETLSNIKPLILYFSKDDEFLNYGVKDKKNNFLSNPNFDKGLCVIGGFGNGKTSIMNTFQRMFLGLDGYSFGRFSSNEIVRYFEDANKHNNPELVDNFWKLMTKSTLYIDDVKSESEALSFGKRNVLNTLFQERYNKELKTYISINYAKGHNNNPLEALLEFKTKYSNQVYDRIFEMYNIIEFKGKSFRK